MNNKEREERNRVLREYGFSWRRDAKGKWEMRDVFDMVVSETEAWNIIGRRTAQNYIQERGVYSRQSVRDVARDLLLHDVLVLDTETTDFHGEVIDLAVIDQIGNVLLDTLVCSSAPIHPAAQAKHHIDHSMLQAAPTFPEMFALLSPLLEGKPVAIYNAEFDLGILASQVKRHGLLMPQLSPFCIMKAYQRYRNEARYTSLELACKQLGIIPGTHRALSDADAARQVLLAMAK